MQQELRAAGSTVELLGINEPGYDTTASFVEDRTLPWLQDDEAVDVWSSWGVAFRDVVIVDQDGQVLDVFNLTKHDLRDDPEYATLLQALDEAG